MNRYGLLGAAVVAFACITSSAHADEPSSTATPATSAPATSPAPTAASPAAASATPADVEPPATSTSHRTAWPWILMGTGIALVVTATVLEIHAVSQDDKREKAEQQEFPGQNAAEHASLVAAAKEHDDSAKSARTQALIVGTIGFLTIAGSVVWWFYEGSSGDAPAPASPGAAKSANSGQTKTKAWKPSFVPSLSPTYAGGALSASF